MIKINLIPIETVKKRSQADLIILGGALGGFIVLSVAGLFFMRKATLNTLEKDIVIAENELRKYQNIVNQVEALKKRKASLEQRRNIIRSLLAGRLTFPKLMDELIASIPEGIWISNCLTKSKGDTVDLDIKASSFTNFAIADWITTLEDSKSFMNVELGTISATKQQLPNTKRSQLILNFQIKCSFRRI